jgi:hypothetical protein
LPSAQPPRIDPDPANVIIVLHAHDSRPKHDCFVAAHTFVAPGDEAPLTLAYQYANGLDVEVWHRARRVGLIAREPKSINLD